MYYELLEKQEEQGLKDRVALCRIEELAPFPWEDVGHALSTYTDSGKKSLEIVWVQEEPRNQGPWPHVGVRLNQLLKERRGLGDVKYIGRKESAVPAVGIGKFARAERTDVLERAFKPL